MINHLGVVVDAFPGPPNRTRCFTHILNLVAKCIMKQFDAPKKKKTGELGENEDHQENRNFLLPLFFPLSTVASFC
jgi:hypothetical protein